ncbi:P-loop containing nucleoside triphosphate hydrolase protein [Mycena galopus ATCC 62051]|nr:P-loop containing nucleoside triphosphate hydrolase protein [Mycena galopus ATCC 62051]
MVGKKKASSKSTSKQQTLFDLFPKKSESAPAILPPHVAPLAVPQPVPPPTLSARTTTDDGPIAVDTPSPPLSQTAGPTASTSKAPEIIDITHSSPTPPPLSSKPTSSRSNKPPSKEPTKPLSSRSDKTRSKTEATKSFESRLDNPSRPPSQKPTSSHSNKPPSSGPSRPPDPIVIDLTSRSSSPPLLPTQPKAPKASYSIFASRPKLEEHALPPLAQAPRRQTYSIFNTKSNKPVLASPAKSSTITQESDAPFPAKDTQHVRGPQTIFPTAAAYPKRSSEKGLEVPMEPFRAQIDTSERCVQRTLTRQPASSFWEKEQCIESIPHDHRRDHPAIARLAAAVTSPPDVSSSSEKLWSDRWRPQRADGVLGNEANAVYLRDWLRALEIRFETPASLDSGKGKEARGVKRPKVMRSVAKPRKRRRQSSDDDEFIVTDASDYSSDVPVETETEGGGDDDEFRPAPGTEVEASPADAFRDHLANTIILSGPSGSGKTTAVYSCAEELGWEVFEVYPGIGRRNGASLETLIGEVGKNHLVRKTQARGIFGRGRDEVAEAGNSADDFGFVTPKLNAGTRQSVIFLEEVDILFKEDANFWPAVIRLIKDCKRAVICTCNDISLIPTGDLPLQTILEFQPCESDVAGSYLQGLCCAEGFIVNRDVLTKMYANGGYDLRHTIHRLQVLCQGFPLGTRPELDHLLDWDVTTRESVPHADLISFMDAYMTRGSLDQPTVSC